MPFDAQFNPRPYRWGIMPVLTVVGNQGNFSPTVAGTATTTVRIPTPFGRAFVGRASAQCRTKVASGGTVTAQLFKRNATGSVNVALTAPFDLKAMTNDVVSNLPILGTLAPAARNLRAGDYLALDIVASSTISTQPADLYFTVELDLKD